MNNQNSIPKTESEVEEAYRIIREIRQLVNISTLMDKQVLVNHLMDILDSTTIGSFGERHYLKSR